MSEIDLSDEDEKFSLLVACVGDSVEFLNGSPVTFKDREMAERKFLRYFMDKSEVVKPPR